MILDFIRSLIGDFAIMTILTIGVWLMGICVYLFVLMELERRREKARIAKGEMSDLEKTILRAWSRL